MTLQPSPSPKAWFYRWLGTHAPSAAPLIRPLAEPVVLLKGIKKFLFPAEWGVGRFEKIGIWHPALSAPFAGWRRKRR